MSCVRLDKLHLPPSFILIKNERNKQFISKLQISVYKCYIKCTETPEVYTPICALILSYAVFASIYNANIFEYKITLP